MFKILMMALQTIAKFTIELNETDMTNRLCLVDILKYCFLVRQMLKNLERCKQLCDCWNIFQCMACVSSTKALKTIVIFLS